MLRAVHGPTDLAWRDAVELEASLRARELSAVELVEHHLERIARIDPAVNAVVTVDAAGARAQAASGRRGTDPGRRARAAARAARRGQGPHGHGGAAHDLRLADLPRPRARRRRGGGRAAARCGCGDRRQDEHAGVRRRVADLQPGLRRHPQPLRPRADGRRLQRRGRGGRRVRARPARRRVRPRELDPQPRVVLQRRRPTSHARPHPRRLLGRRVGHDAGAGADRPQRAGHRPLPARRGWSRSARPALAARRPASRPRARARRRHRRDARGVEPQPGRPAGGAGGDRRAGARADGAGRARLHGRRRGARPGHRRRGVRDPARRRLRRGPRGAPRRAPRPRQGHRRLERRAGARAARRGRGPGDRAADGGVPPHAGPSWKRTTCWRCRSRRWCRSRSRSSGRARSPARPCRTTSRGCARARASRAVGCPAIAVPGGFTPEGLPVGLQLVGRPGGEHALLRVAYAFEQATRHGLRRPPVAV